MGVLNRLAKRAVHGLLRRLGYDVRRLVSAPPIPPQPQTAAVRQTLQAVPLRSLVAGDVKIRLLEAEQANGNVSLGELAAINTFVARRHAKTVFEIGTFDGRTTLNMAANAAPPGLFTRWTCREPR